MATQLKRSRVRDVSSTLVGSKHLYARPKNANQIKLTRKIKRNKNFKIYDKRIS